MLYLSNITNIFVEQDSVSFNYRREFNFTSEEFSQS